MLRFARDDYLTDKKKLQRQVDFLDAHPDFSICFHPVVVKFEDGSVPDYLYPKQDLIEGYHLQVEYLLFAIIFKQILLCIVGGLSLKKN